MPRSGRFGTKIGAAPRNRPAERRSAGLLRIDATDWSPDEALWSRVRELRGGPRGVIGDLPPASSGNGEAGEASGARRRVTSQLGLFAVIETEPPDPSDAARENAPLEVERAPRSPSANIRSVRQAVDSRAALPRLCVKPDEAARMLSVSRDYFDKHVEPELRIVHRGTRTVLVPVAELVRWVERNAARYP